MEASQDAELTSTNRPCGLTTSSSIFRRWVAPRLRLRHTYKIWTFSGAYGGEVTPDPIPNSEVKLSSANGTAWVTMWESRTVPDFFLEGLVGFYLRGLLLFLNAASPHFDP